MARKEKALVAEEPKEVTHSLPKVIKRIKFKTDFVNQENLIIFE
jgi:hypothetical protein